MGKKIGRPAILSEADKRRIRKAKRLRSLLSNKALAHQYGVSMSLIGDIK